MSKKLLHFAAILLINGFLYGQCPTGDLTISTQADLDAFAANYPGCTTLTTNLTISGANITDFSGLAQITQMNAALELRELGVTDMNGWPGVEFFGANGSFSVFDTPILATLMPISGELNAVPGIQLQFMTALSSLDAFSGVTRVGNLRIENCHSLINFQGLENTILDSNGLAIGPNNVLEDISQLSGNLGTLDDISITGNMSLLSLEGLEGVELRDFNSILSINNTVLTDLDPLSSITEAPDFLWIQNNTDLSDITGLANITGEVAQMELTDNESLTDFTGLEGITMVTDFLNCAGNTALTSLNGLNGLRDTVSQMDIDENPVLTDISAIAEIDQIGILTITDNVSLSECDIASVCTHVFSGRPTQIFDNGAGCNSLAEVEQDCSDVDIPDANFLDTLVNHNPVIDTNSDGAIQFTEAEAFTFTINATSKNIADFTGLEAFINITGFEGDDNSMITLSMVSNTELTSVVFADNPSLETVNLKNGNNISITDFQGSNCPQLRFVCVDDVPFAEANFTDIDPQVDFVDDCQLLSDADISAPFLVRLYPNPVKQVLHIELDGSDALVAVSLYSMMGQRVLISAHNEIDLAAIESGIYFVRVETAQGTLTQKIVKQ